MYVKKIPATPDDAKNENISYSYKEALVHKICNLSPFLPKTSKVEIKDNGKQIVIEMEKLETSLKEPTIENKISAWKNILQAVALLNFFGIAHRDIKDENILYRNGKDAVLIDFGLSKPLLGGFHTPKIVSEFYRAPELDKDLDVQQYGFEVDAWSLGIWGLELFNEDFDATDYVPIWKEAYKGNQKAKKVIDSYLENVPDKLRNVLSSFLLPSNQRKKASDWVKIPPGKHLFYYPDSFICPIPSEYAEWAIGYKSIYWSLSQYYKDDKLVNKDKNLQCLTVWASSLILFPFEISIKELAHDYKLADSIIYSKVHEWFMKWKVIKV